MLPELLELRFSMVLWFVMETIKVNNVREYLDKQTVLFQGFAFNTTNASPFISAKHKKVNMVY